MRTVAVLASVGMLAVPIAGCQKQDDTTKHLEQIEKRLARIERAIATGGGPGAARGRRAAPQRPPGPNPTEVYSVPIEGSAYVGPKHAKVTVVEGFEFA